MGSIHTLLIANRGEIARRILRTCRALGIRGAVVYTDADTTLPFVREADVGVRIGAGPVGESYLSIPAILEAARRTGADAVHPGYGFLSENAAFARAVRDAGLIWVGPPPEAIETMGDKAAARRLAAAHKVPVLPGYDGDAQDPDPLARQAARIGTPLLVKATAGGGGRGLRRVDDLEALPAAVEAARREARGAFGSDRVLLERFVEHPRHIEVQILGDAHGTLLHLGERECSIQRRHQKIVEEAPSPAVGPELRRALGEAALRVARAVNYEGAGTVEFLLEPDGRFWFLEMNTRLQVEHPVTELVTGHDLVALQLQVAAGEALPMYQGDVRMEGHAIEVRLVAEDPMADFRPATGTLLRVDLPGAGGDRPGVRVDAGHGPGDAVSPHYDALIAKIIAHGPDRAAATRRLRRVLDEAWVPGLPTNLRLLGQILDAPAWAEGGLTTDFLARQGLPVAPPLHVVEGVRAATVLGWWQRRGTQVVAGWRLDGPAEQRDRWTSFGVEAEARWQAQGRDRVRVAVRVGEDPPVEAEVRVLEAPDEGLVVEVDGLRQRWRLVTADGGPVRDGSTVYAHLGNGVEAMVGLLPRHPAPGLLDDDPGTLTAPTPGTILEVRVVPGQEVAAGDVLVVLEAMKVEHTVRAAEAGTVEAVSVEAGEAVSEGAVLVRLTVEDGGG